MMLVVEATIETENGNVGYARVDFARIISIIDGRDVKFIICVATIPKIATELIKVSSLVSGIIYNFPLMELKVRPRMYFVWIKYSYVKDTCLNIKIPVKFFIQFQTFLLSLHIYLSHSYSDSYPTYNLSDDFPTWCLHISVSDDILGIAGSILKINVQIKQFRVPLHQGNERLSLEQLRLAIKLLPCVLESKVSVSGGDCAGCGSLCLLQEPAEAEHVLNLLRRHSY